MNLSSRNVRRTALAAAICIAGALASVSTAAAGPHPKETIRATAAASRCPSYSLCLFEHANLGGRHLDLTCSAAARASHDRVVYGFSKRAVGGISSYQRTVRRAEIGNEFLSFATKESGNVPPTLRLGGFEAHLNDQISRATLYC